MDFNSTQVTLQFISVTSFYNKSICVIYID